MFRRFRRSVRFKLLALMLATTLVALVVAVAALVAYDTNDYYDRVVSDLTTQAEILGRSSVASTLRSASHRPSRCRSTRPRLRGRARRA